MVLADAVCSKALELQESDKKAFWKFVKEHGPFIDRFAFIQLASTYVQNLKDGLKSIFRLALYTNLTFLLDAAIFPEDQELNMDDKQIASFYRRKLQSHQSRNHLRNISEPAHSFNVILHAHRALLKALIKYGHEDFVFYGLEPYTGYIKKSPTTSLLVIKRLYQSAKQLTEFKSEDLEYFQEKVERVFRFINLSPSYGHVKLDIFCRMMSDDETVIPEFVDHDLTLFPQPIYDLYFEMTGWQIQRDSDFFEMFSDPSRIFTRLYTRSMLSLESERFENFVDFDTELYDFKHLRSDDVDAASIMLDLFDRDYAEYIFDIRDNFILNSEPAVFAKLSKRFQVDIESLAMIDAARAYELMESGSLMDIELGRPSSPSPDFPDWLFPCRNDSDLVKLTKQIILNRPNLRLLHKVATKSEGYLKSYLLDYATSLIAKLKKRNGSAQVESINEEKISPIQVYVCHLEGYLSELFDCAKSDVVYLQDYLLTLSLNEMLKKCSPSILEIPLHYFEYNKELVPLLAESMSLPASPKLAAVFDMCQYLFDYSPIA